MTGSTKTTSSNAEIHDQLREHVVLQLQAHVVEGPAIADVSLRAFAEVVES